MLFTEWNLEDAMAVRYEEGLEDGKEEGRIDEKLEIARNLLAEGSTPEFVQKITGLDLEMIAGIDNCRRQAGRPAAKTP